MKKELITDFQAKYFAHELSRRGGAGVERVGKALFDACVDLNPHQIEASLFSLRSPLQKGVLLADEVGLGKTIEAGLSICQYWAEKKRNILVICPASLRKQWAIELQEKFNLPAFVLDAKIVRDSQKTGIENAFNMRGIIIISLHYASRMANEIKQIRWDLVVIDEAHKLRNAYRPSNKMGNSIRWATEGAKKILLTATPLQNSLTELFGISTLIDENIFGDISSFRSQYMNMGGDLEGLRHRLKSFVWRTLRRQVLEYVRFTQRKLVTRPFNPSDQEHALYQEVSNFLMADESYALPKAQKHLLTLLVRKALASSPLALAGTLRVIQTRLIKLKDDLEKERTPSFKMTINDFLEDEIYEEIMLDSLDESDDLDNEQAEEQEEKISLKLLDKEIQTLGKFIEQAESIGENAKSLALLSALRIGFEEMQKMGAAQKAVIFTESRRTQGWLKDYLEANGYADKVLTFNGTNKDDATGEIYKEWLSKNQTSGRISGSKQIDLRAAILDSFKNDAAILIATEAGAEGLNLQFASLVVNFDLPWNPQRIEQRIGRCHRYGQKHDVVVINFLNKKNEADRRVYELLSEKFNLFSGVFGASDEVLGSLESGVDFERRILEIYQSCRSTEEITQAFERLQKELDDSIQNKMQQTRQKLLEHFDEEVHHRLKVNHSDTISHLDRIGKIFWSLTKHVLKDNAIFNEKDHSFLLEKSPISESKRGLYKLISKESENIQGEFLYRLSHPLGEHVIETAKAQNSPYNQVVFDISNHPVKISMVEALKGKSGFLKLDLLTIDSLESEQYLLFTAIDEKGNNIDQETCERMMTCSAYLGKHLPSLSDMEQRLKDDGKRHIDATLAKNMEENNKHFNQAREQLESWAEDMVKSVELELDNIKRQIREKRRLARQSVTLQEQHDIQQDISKLDKQKRKMRSKIFEAEDQVEEKRDKLISALSARLKQKTEVQELFVINWKVV